MGVYENYFYNLNCAGKDDVSSCVEIRHPEKLVTLDLHVYFGQSCRNCFCLVPKLVVKAKVLANNKNPNNMMSLRGNIDNLDLIQPPVLVK